MADNGNTFQVVWASVIVPAVLVVWTVFRFLADRIESNESKTSGNKSRKKKPRESDSELDLISIIDGLNTSLTSERELTSLYRARLETRDRVLTALVKAGATTKLRIKELSDEIESEQQ